MSRPQKQGLDYFPFDVDFFSNEKIEAIGGEFGTKGELITIHLLCTVYRNGYFVRWNGLLRGKIARRVQGASPELVDQVINRLVEWSMFDKQLFHSAKVLTSGHIQEIFKEATKRRINSDIDPSIKVTPKINVYINPRTGGVNADIYPQSKVKESKVKESNKNICENVRSEVKEVIDVYHSICVDLGKVLKVTDARKKNISKLLKKYSLEEIKEVCTKAQESDFLAGRKGTWKANFDWLIKDANFVKVLEGVYDNRFGCNVGEGCKDKKADRVYANGATGMWEEYK